MHVYCNFLGIFSICICTISLLYHEYEINILLSYMENLSLYWDGSCIHLFWNHFCMNENTQNDYVIQFKFGRRGVWRYSLPIQESMSVLNGGRHIQYIQMIIHAVRFLMGLVVVWCVLILLISFMVTAPALRQSDYPRSNEHYITWTSWSLKSPATRLFVQETSKLWPFVIPLTKGQ